METHRRAIQAMYRSLGCAALAFISYVSMAADHDAITVEDLTREAVFDPVPADDGSIGLRSPDGEQAIEVVRRGDPTELVNVAELFDFNLRKTTSGPRFRVLARFSSSGRFKPISAVKWLNDSTLSFLATDEEGVPQVFTLGMNQSVPRQLTHSTRPITWYALSEAQDKLVTSEQSEAKPIATDPECRARGCRITADTLDAALNGLQQTSRPLNVINLKTQHVHLIPSPESVYLDLLRCYDGLLGGISPDGRYGVQLCRVRAGQWPAWWADYAQLTGLGTAVRAGETGLLRRMIVVDLRTGERHLLTEAPIIPQKWDTAPPLWMEGHHLLLAAAVEPLSNITQSERDLREAVFSALDVDVASGSIQRIARLGRDVRKALATHWDARTKTLDVEYGDENGAPLRDVDFRRKHGNWRIYQPSIKVSADAQKLRLSESLNQRPVFTANGRPIYDPNGWLQGKKLASVGEIAWNSRDGKMWRGGIYRPLGVSHATALPLVIQTHGFDPKRFTLTGLNANFVAQVLAGSGIVVVQVDDEHIPVQGVKEFDAAVAGYEGLIDHLSAIGLIDRSRVGIEGWSRAGAYVEDMMARSAYPLAAALTIEPGNFGWWSYVQSGGESGESVYGGPPFGDGLLAWIESAPTFHLDRVTTPLLMWDSEAPTWQWDWYALLRRLKKPVEYWVFPDGAHEAYRIEERIRSGHLAVDWFCFWLKGEERRDPEAFYETAASVLDQYGRWRQYRSENKSVATTR